MADIRISPVAGTLAFTSSLGHSQVFTQDSTGALVLQGSGDVGRSNLFAVDGINGRLFSIDDDLSDSLFSVNTIAGLPVIEAFADNSITMGQYGQNVFKISGTNVGIGIASPTTPLHVNGIITATEGNSTNWNTSYSWGNHASAGYLTSYTDTNTTYTAGTGLTLSGTTFSVTSNGISATQLNVSGNGTTAQFLRSDGDGTFTWATPTDTNTTYSVGNGGLTEINFTSALNTKLAGIATGANNYVLPFTDNSTQWNTAYGWGNHASQGYATQTYVNTAVSNLIDTAPSTLDTLNELAAALGDDPNFATTVTNSIAGKLSLAGGTITGNLTVQGTTYLGNANGDETHINDILRVGATDSGDSHFYFGEGALAGSDYGSHWHWDSGYTFTWNTRNGGTDTSLFDYVTNDTTYINWRRNFHMQNKDINYARQLHFNGGTRFVSSNTNYLIFKTDATNAGGILVQDGNGTLKGYTGYYDSSGFGLLNSGGAWGIRLNPGNGDTLLYSGGNWKLTTRSGGIGVQGNVYTDVNYGYGLVGLYSAERYQGVFAMGDSYKLSADGTSSGSLYGIAWTHANVGGQSKSGLGHQMLIMENGTTTTAIGRGIWTNGTITTTSHGTSANWNTAFGWGNHASAGYQAASTAITTSNIGSQSVSSATTLNSSNSISQRGSNGSWNADFTATPAGTLSYGGDVGANTTNNPGGSWWIQQNFRHTNASNIWGTQVAWGWEDNQNKLATRNVSGGNWGAWVYYLNSSNFTTYAATAAQGSNATTAYGWGNHASAGYLLTSGKAADSNLLDGLDSTEFGRVTPSGTWYSFTDPLTDTSGFIDASWVNKFEFFDTSKITVETSTDDITYTVTTEYSDAQLKNLMGGDGNAGINIPNLGVIGTAYKRFTFTNNGYVSLSMLYEYVTRVTGTLDMKVEKRQVDTWSIVKDYTNVGGWPAHVALRHNTIWFHPSTTSTGHHWQVRVTIKGTTTNASYINHTINKLQWWGGYPAGRRNLFYTDSNKNASFPATLTAVNINGELNGNATTAGSAGSVTGLTLNRDNSPINPDNVTQNQIGYSNSVALLGQSDGGLYSSAYSSSWIHQIFGDFRTGQIAIRGKNNGIWQAWRTVIDSSNFTTYAATAAQGANATTAYGWGNHATAGYSNASNLSSGTVPYARTNKVLPTSGNYVWNASTPAGDYEIGVQTSFVNAALGFPEYGAVLHIGARGATDAGGDFQIYCGHGSTNGGNHLRFRNADNDANPSDSWTAFKIIWDSENLVNNQDNWNTAYGWGNHSGLYLPLSGGTITTSANYGVVINHSPALGDFVDALTLRSTTSGQRAQIGFATVGTDGDHHRASIRAYKGDGNFDGVFGIALRQTDATHVQRFTLTSTGNLTIDGQMNVSGGNSSNWNTAYGWGNHASQGYATQTYVNTAVSNLVDAAPGTLDTLNELAAALGDDPNFATTVTNSIAGKLSLAGGTMTGDIIFNDNIRLEYSTTHWITPRDSSGNMHLHTATGGIYLDAPVIYIRERGSESNLITIDNGTLTATGTITATGGNSTNWNTAYGWGNHASAGYITGYTETDTLATVTNRGNSTSQNLVFSNGRKGLVGVYDAAQTQAIFAMGASYVLTDGGGSGTIGNHYGLAWSYNPNYGGSGNNPQSKAGLEHQLLVMNAGITRTALGVGIWTSGLITTTSYGTSANWNTAYGWGNHAGLYAAASHTHTIANVTGLQAALDGKQAAGTYLTSLGFSYSTGVTANHVVQRDANGYIYANHINFSTGETENPTISSFFVSNGDGWSRKASIAHVKGQLGLGSAAYVATSTFAAAAHDHDRSFITDSRGSSRAPSYYDDRYAQWDFQNVSDTGVGGDGWHALLTVSKWAVLMQVTDKNN
jgi:hypothetical protein